MTNTSEPDHGSPPIRLAWCALTDAGRFKDHNEDACLCLACGPNRSETLDATATLDLREDDFICAVSDGMGGAVAGERASQLVVNRVGELIPRAFAAAASGLHADYLGLLEEAVHSVHHAINDEARDDPARAGMGATLSLAWFAPDRVWFVHIGDSRIYRYHDGRLQQLTHDHTRVGHLFRSGLLNERQARMHPRRNVLQQAVGAGLQKVEPQLGSLRYRPDDWFLICSDGLVDGLWDKNILEIFDRCRDLPDGEGTAARELLDRSLRSSGRDNTSLIVVRAMDAGR